MNGNRFDPQTQTLAMQKAVGAKVEAPKQKRIGRDHYDKIMAMLTTPCREHVNATHTEMAVNMYVRGLREQFEREFVA